MSTFEINIRPISMINPHPNADKLELAGLKGMGYTIIVGKGQYQVDDLVVLFPPDSILPKELIEHFQLTFLHKGNRVKETKLRGVVSQALVLPYLEIYNYSQSFREFYHNQEVGTMIDILDFAESLGVEKYEPEESINLRGVKESGRLPEGVEKYDLENAERYQDVFLHLYNRPVVITEKLEGTNWGLHIDRDGVIHSLKRSSMVDEENIYHRASVESGLVRFIQIIKDDLDCDTVTLRGELVGEGIQGNIYKLKGHKVFLFDMMIDGNYLTANVFYYMVYSFKEKLDNIFTAPIIFDGLLKDFADTPEILKELSNGASQLLETQLREGIVIKPYHEENRFGFGRVALKQRSPVYLSKAD